MNRSKTDGIRVLISNTTFVYTLLTNDVANLLPYLVH